MDSVSGSLKQSEPCSPCSPGSPDPMQDYRRPTSPHTITRALTNLQRGEISFFFLNVHRQNLQRPSLLPQSLGFLKERFSLSLTDLFNNFSFDNYTHTVFHFSYNRGVNLVRKPKTKLESRKTEKTLSN